MLDQLGQNLDPVTDIGLLGAVIYWIITNAKDRYNSGNGNGVKSLASEVRRHDMTNSAALDKIAGSLAELVTVAKVGEERWRSVAKQLDRIERKQL